jgi:trimeric autotransporter adhesin
LKPLPALAAVAIALVLLVSPMVSAAGTTVSITSPTPGTSYKGSGSYTISGTVSSSSTQADTVSIAVTGPNGLVDAYTASVGSPGSSGTFSYPTHYGSSSAWTSGTYTITVTDGDTPSATASETFAYTSTTSPTYNVTQALVNIQGNLTLIENELKTMNNTVNADTTTIGTINSALTTLSGQVGTISSNVGTLVTDMSSLTSTVGTINTNVQTVMSSLPSAGSISTTQTYVLVVAVLAAITLVLELAILIRKLS